MNLLPITIVPPNQQPQLQIGFYARTLVVDNPTAAYWYLPNILRFVPPFVTGMVIALPGTETFSILYQAPPGLTQPPALVGTAAASFVFHEEALGADSGMSLSANAFGRSVSMIQVGFTTPQTAFTFVQPAPDGFVIVPESSQAGPFSNLFVDLAYGGPLLTTPFGALFVKRLWAQNVVTRLTTGDYAQIVYRRPVPAQSTLLLGGNGLNAVLLI